MHRLLKAICGYLFIAMTLSACASAPVLPAPDTLPGERIQRQFLVGEWCTNREQTATSNQQAGFSGLLNVRPVFWRFGEAGEWEISTSGFLFESYGSWQVEGLDELLLGKKEMEPQRYQASFRDGDLYLTDDKGQFTVLSPCA